MSEELEYPIRINRYLALNNICSRREADELVRHRKVKINGKLARLGDPIMEEDVVELVDENKKKLVYFAFNKPTGVVTHSPQWGEKSILDLTKFPERVFPVGRLDKDSYGLIIMTNDGRVTGKLLEPEQDHDKEYIVKVDRPISEHFLREMAMGVKLDDGYRTKKASVRQKDKFSFVIILTEGKKRQIRRMCEALGFQVVELYRRRIMNIQLKDLRSGRYRSLQGSELKDFLKALRLK